MIITLKGANFSLSNIGKLDSWNIEYSLGAGADEGQSATSVKRDNAYSGTITIDASHELGANGVTVTMGGNPVTTGITIDGNTITISIDKVTGKVVINVPTKDIVTGEEDSGAEIPTDYISYKGTSAFTDVGQRVQWNTDKWVDTHSGTTSAGTELIPVSSADSIWISKIAVVNGTLASGGFYDMGQNLVAPLYWGTFGIDQEEAKATIGNFVAPEGPVTIASVEEANNCEIAYVKFTAWAASASENTGIENTEARVYYANGIPQDPTYVSYVGEDVFTFNKQTFTDTGYTTSGSSSAYSTDYIEVTPEQGVWLQYIFTMSDAHRCVGLFDSNKTFIKSITMSDFGLAQGDKFKTPAAPVKISDLEGTENVAYVRFVAWTTSDGGRANTEARIYSY